MMYELDITTQINYRNWDYHTCTAADFTLKFILTKEIWNMWEQETSKEEQRPFKDYLSEKIKEQVSKCDPVHQEEIDEGKKEIEIA